jgi:hypothetical protein
VLPELRNMVRCLVWRPPDLALFAALANSLLLRLSCCMACFGTMPPTHYLQCTPWLRMTQQLRRFWVNRLTRDPCCLQLQLPRLLPACYDDGLCA